MVNVVPWDNVWDHLLHTHRIVEYFLYIPCFGVFSDVVWSKGMTAHSRI